MSWWPCVRRLFAIAVMAAGLLASAPRARRRARSVVQVRQRLSARQHLRQSNVCTALPKKKSVIPFYFHQPGEEGYRHIIPLLYFPGWDKHRDTKVQIPFFARRTDKDNHRALTVIPLLFSSLDKTAEKTEVRIWPFIFGAKYRPAGGRAAIVPLFWWQRRNKHTWLVFPLFLSGGQRDDNNDVTEAVFGLVGYYRRHGDDTWRVFVPRSSEHRRKRHETFVGPSLGARGRRESSVIFPLWWHVLDRESGTEHTVFLPMFDSSRRIAAASSSSSRSSAPGAATTASMRTVIV